MALPASCRAGKTVMGINTAFVHLGSACNLYCPHCADRYFVKETSRTWLPELLKKSLTILSSFPDIRTVALTGGEPTCNPLFAEAVQWSVEQHFHVDLFTNAVWPFTVTVPHLCQSGISRLVVSMDSLSDLPAHGRAKAISRHPREVIEEAAASMKVIVITTVSQANLYELPEIIKFCASLGVSHLLEPIDAPAELSRLSLKNLPQDNAMALHSALDLWASVRDERSRAGLFLSVLGETVPNEVVCDCGREMITLFPNGRLYPCLFLRQKHPGWPIFEMPPEQLCQVISEWRDKTDLRRCARTICYGCLSLEGI